MSPDGEALRAALPPAPARVFVAGIAPEALTARWRALGYAAASIGPGWRIESESQAPETADAIVWTGVNARFDPLTIFYRSFDLLGPGGTLVLTRPVAEELGLAAVQGESPDKYLSGLAERNGFRPESTGPGAQEPLRFTKDTEPRWRVRLAEEHDVPELRDLFQEVFGHEISPEFWHWKYGAGRGAGTIALQGGRIVAHYGGIPRRILYFGEPRIAYGIGDVMVQSRERAVLTRVGPFMLTAVAMAEVAAYWAAHASKPEDQLVQAFGFPNERHFRLAERTGLYVEADRISAVHWTPFPGRPRLMSRVRYIGSPLSPADARVVEELWRVMRADHADGLIGVRDARWLRERYLEHPEHHYDVLLVSSRFSRRPLGVLVIRRQSGQAELMDLVAPRRHVTRLVAQARRLCGRWGLPEMFCWITRSQAPLLVATGGVEKPLDIVIPASHYVRSTDPDASVDRVLGKWWLTAGDTDFR